MEERYLTMRVYVVSPSYLISGGPDALHQMVYYLRNIGIEADIVYFDLRKKVYKIPPVYSRYTNDYLLLKDIVDDKENVVILPETLYFLKDNFKHLQIYVWWLSVNNNTDTSIKQKLGKLWSKLNPSVVIKLLKRKNKLETFKSFLNNKKIDFSDKHIKHLCASYYAYDYVNNINKTSASLLIEPISLSFLQKSNADNIHNRENIILYNPKKNLAFTKQIIKCCKNYTFLPLKGYNQDQLIELYQRATLYIDFGFFPGAERIPKEAVMNGCNIITGLNGASAFYNDVPIPSDYKIASTKENIPLIKEKIDYMMSHYKDCFHDFDAYRNHINRLEDCFIKDLEKLFKK